jgi:hypothetical protein
MKTCPACQHTYPDVFYICARDGTRLEAGFCEERECPYCAERILKTAPVCKHCGRDVEPMVKSDTPDQAPSPTPQGRMVEPPSPLPQRSKPVAAASRPPAVDASLARSEAEEIWRARSDADLLSAVRRLAEYTEEDKGVIRAELRRRGLDEPRR